MTRVALSGWKFKSGALSTLAMCVVAQLANRKTKEMIRIDFFHFSLLDFIVVPEVGIEPT